jgi:L-alanine-DL-glutamate epimerase-like enolase superfamily enzyme
MMFAMMKVTIICGTSMNSIEYLFAGVSIGGEPACYIIEHHLSRFVEGQDPTNVELIWDQMFRSTINYGRKGLPL